MATPSILIENIIIPDDSGKQNSSWVLVENTKITSLGRERFPGETTTTRLNGCGLTLLPGFIDLHTHGGLGHEMIGIDKSGLQELSLFYASHGVTGFLASTWTAPIRAIARSINVVESVIGSEKGARILGVHLEGPWLNPLYCGAQEKSLIHPADKEEAFAYLNSDLIKLIALAPEIPENQWLISECERRGITVSAGHTDATYSEMQMAFKLGVRQVTHCFNAMRPFHHREPGVIGAALTNPNLKCELIADNIHVHPAAMKLLYQCKGADGIILITDSISAAGMPDGSYSFEGAPVTLKDGAARLADGTLAGSALTMERALVNLMQATGSSLPELIPCSSANAAKAIHLEQCKGRIAPGFDADLILVDQNLQVKLTMVAGKIVYRQF